MRNQPVTDPAIIGDTANALGEMVLMQADAPGMGGLLLLLSETTGWKYMLAAITREEHGSYANVFELTGAHDLASARTAVDSHHLIRGLKAKLLFDLLTATKQ